MRRGLCLALALLVLTALILLLSGIGSTELLEPPGNLTLASISVPGEARFEGESLRALLLVRGDGSFEARLSWEPGDGLGRIRQIPDDSPFPVFPKTGVLDKITYAVRNDWNAAVFAPAIAVLCPLDSTGLPLPPRRKIGTAPIYLAGTGPDGNLRTLPFQVGNIVARELLRDLGTGTIPSDLVNGTGPRGGLELRITRVSDRVRYRWGRDPVTVASSTEARLAWGSAELDADLVARGGVTPLLPKLAAELGKRATGAPGKVVFYELGTGVRSVDLLRAVECGAGDPNVLFVPYPCRAAAMSWDQEIGLPLIGRSMLIEDLDIRQSGKRSPLWALMDEQGVAFVKGVPMHPDEFGKTLAALGVGATVVFGRGRNCLWSDHVPYLAAAVRSGAKVYYRLAPLDPTLGIAMAFHLPVTGATGEVIECEFVRIDGVLTPVPEGIDGLAVRVHIAPFDATLEETIHALIRLRHLGATAFTFR
jgi:hypothetical protein